MANNIREMYVSVPDGVVLYASRDQCNVLSKKDKDGTSRPHYYTLNETGLRILAQVDGSKRTSCLIEEFRSSSENSRTVSDEDIFDFICSMVDFGILRLSASSPGIHSAAVSNDTTIQPLHASIEVTDRCNCRCKHCYMNGSPQNSKVMSFDQFKTLTERLVDLGVLCVELTGGELLIHPDAQKIIAHAYDNFEAVGILTNGIALTPHIADLIISNKHRTVVGISIDSHLSSIHDEFRGYKGAWEAACKSVQTLSEAGVVVRVASCLTEETMWDIENIAKLSLKLGAKVFSYSFAESAGRGVELLSNSNPIDAESASKYAGHIANLSAKYEKLIPIVKSDQEADGLKTNCGFGSSSMTISPDGTIRGCNLAPSTLPLGNIFSDDKDYVDNAMSKRLSATPAPTIANGCAPDCSYLNHCTQCIYRALEINATTGVVCPWIQANKLEDILASYCKKD